LVYVGKAAGWNFGILGVMDLASSDGTVDNTLYISSVYAKGKAGPANLSAEVAYAFGHKDYADAIKTDLDLQSIMAYLGASIPAGPVTIDVEAAYASGDNSSTADKIEGALRVDTHSPFDSVVLFPGKTDINGYALESTAGGVSVGNAVAGKLTVTAKPAAGLTIAGAAVYAQRLEDVKDAKTGAITKADPLGIELDLIVAYAITPNVTWKVGAGYLLTGDFYGDADNAMALSSNFTVKF